MKTNHGTYENYPWRTITTTAVFQLAIYFIAGFIIYQFGLIWFLIYLVYFIVLEITFYPRACVYCYYYGKWCAFGKGKVVGLLWTKKDPAYFCKREASFTKMLPELLVVIVPVILGIILLTQSFQWWILALIILDVFLVSFGNGWLRGKLTCPHCKQGEICCPALAMFNKKK